MPSTRKRVWLDETPRRNSEATPPGAPVTSTVPPGASWSASRSEVSWRRASSADRKASALLPREPIGVGARVAVTTISLRRVVSRVCAATAAAGGRSRPVRLEGAGRAGLTPDFREAPSAVDQLWVTVYGGSLHGASARRRRSPGEKRGGHHGRPFSQSETPRVGYIPPNRIPTASGIALALGSNRTETNRPSPNNARLGPALIVTPAPKLNANLVDVLSESLFFPFWNPRPPRK